MIENIATRIFGEKKERLAVPTNLMELKVRGNFEGAPIIPLFALESDYISNTGPYIKTKFAEELWLKNNQLADDRFDKIQSDEKEPSGILIGMDQANYTGLQSKVHADYGQTGHH